MKLTLGRGEYIVAVSGGVDSMALLHMLRAISGSGVRLIVAHYDHGIRPDSDIDRRLTQAQAKAYGMTFVFDQGKLGRRASEAAAREARYKFLHRVKDAVGAKAIITAHHQDDLLETALLNLMRGTGRKGMSSLRTTDTIVRPLLDVPKIDIVNYAMQNHLSWREDSTNKSMAYKRNYIRKNIIPKMTYEDKQKLLLLIDASSERNDEIDAYLSNILHLRPSFNSLSRNAFAALPHDVAREVLASFLRMHGVRSFDRKGIERMTIALKTRPAGKYIDINQQFVFYLETTTATILPRMRL